MKCRNLFALCVEELCGSGLHSIRQDHRPLDRDETRIKSDYLIQMLKYIHEPRKGKF